MMNRAMIALFVLSLLGSATVFVSALSPPHCWEFNTGVGTDWQIYTGGIYTYDWKFTADGNFPDDTSIPSFVPYTHTVSYTWFQDQADPPVQGEIRTIAPVTLNIDDVLSAKIFRNILDGRDNDSDRPVLRFTDTSVAPVRTVDLVYSVYYRQWDTIYAFSCGTAAPDHTICCTAYPCTGYLQIDGQVLIRDELLAIDNVGLNGGCGGPTPPPTPGQCDCNFNADFCNWEHCNWDDSATVPPPAGIPPSPSGDGFAYIINDSGVLLLSAGIIVTTSTFSFDYYLYSTSASNELIVSFITSAGIRYPVGGQILPPTGSAWTTTGPILCPNCCAGLSSCTGTLEVAAYYTLGTTLYAAVDNFVGSFDSCPIPVPPPSGTCSYTFDSDVTNWSPNYISDGWIWSGFTPSPNVPPSPSGTNFIYIHQTSAAAWFPATNTYPYNGYVEITPCTVLSFNYYLTGGSGDYMTVSFRPTAGILVTIGSFPATSTATWKNTGPLYVPYCTTYPCDGQIVITTHDSPSTVLDAGIDDFTLTGAVYNGYYCS